MDERCPICQNNAIVKVIHYSKDNQSFLELEYNCPHCGDYQLPNKKVIDYFGSLSKDNLFYLRCYMNEHKSTQDPLVLLRLDKNQLNLISEGFPKDVDDKLNKILNFLKTNTHFFGERVNLTPEVSYSTNPSELGRLINELESDGLIKKSLYLNGTASAFLTKKGHDYVNDRNMNNHKNSCFIAMWFDQRMDIIWREIIKPACEETGYRPIRIDEEQFNDDIIDNVVKSIRESSFIIAELTGYRGGVYYEAGLAKGLGKQVIFCCKDKYTLKVEYEGSRKKVAETGPHFDVNHQKTILWKDDKLGEYKQQLKDRIIATIGRGTYNSLA